MALVISAVAALSLTVLAPLATPPAEAERDLAARLEEALGAEALAGARAAVCVRRVSDGHELFAREADLQLIPASNLKIVTTAAALRYLGPDFRFVTDAYLTPGTPAELDVVGFGDPYLVPERLWYLATRIYFAGVREVGDVVVDDSYFAGPRFAGGVEQDPSDSAYMAPTGAVSAGFNAILIHVLPGPVAGAAARVLVDPASSYAELEAPITTVARGKTKVHVDVSPRGDHSRVRVTGRIVLGDTPFETWRRVDNPPVFAGRLLETLLTQVGVKVRGRVRAGPRAATAVKLTSVESPALAEVVSDLNKSSNNFMAEQIALALGAARQGAPATWEKARASLEGFLEDEVGLERGSYRIGNASGLHDVNRMSARQLVRVLEYVQRSPAMAPEFVASLAVAGASGTLTDRMRSTDAAHLLRAKTGTLSNASALSGYVTTKGGDTLAFSIIVNDYRCPVSEVWRVQDRIGAALASLGGSEPGPLSSRVEGLVPQGGTP
jgi:D-alanyl-D-alanine carboxypeptidase/D-alanyl-D-alanine-endopeptidase (penicillin-binding protein 4)